MGLYIPNIEMPKSCDVCPHPTCTLWQSVNGRERHEKCPIIPVPPHGRLIDADTEIFVEVLDNMTEDYSIKKCTVKEALDLWTRDGCPPTIIPAEEGET